MKNTLLIAYLSLSVFATAQLPIQIKGTIVDFPEQKTYLWGVDEAGLVLLDSVTADSKGNIEFYYDGDLGMYRLGIDHKNYIDLMISEKKIEFKVEGSLKSGETSFNNEDENSLYQYYREEFNLLKEGIDAINEELKKIDIKSAEHLELKKELTLLQKDRKRLLRNLWTDPSDSWAARLAVAEQEIIPDRKISREDMQSFKKKHHFDYFDFTDSVLMSSPIFFQKIDTFLELTDFNKKIDAQNWRSVQQILDKLFWISEIEPRSQERVVNHLFKKYPHTDYPEVYDRVADAYQTKNTCEYSITNRTIQNRILKSKKLHRMNELPDFPLYNVADQDINSLSDIEGKIILIVIWSGSCIHSNNFLEKIKPLYNKYHKKGFEILTISIDNNKKYWENVLLEHDYYWINACDLSGLKGETASLFNIYATPITLLIDNNRNLLLQPLTHYQIEQKLKELFGEQ